MTIIAVLDIGSTSTKGLLIDGNGIVIATESAAYATSSPQPTWMEQNPDDWWKATVRLLRSLSAHALPDAIGLTGSMQNLIALDRSGRPVRPAILYSDTRAAPEEDPSDAVAAIVGNRLDPFMPIAKISWLRRHEPEVFHQTGLVLSCAKDYISLQLTGIPACDATAATTVGLMDLARRTWSAALLERFDLAESLFPPILDADAVIGGITPAAAAEVGLPVGIPVVNGCGDAGSTSIGAGADTPGDAVVYLGTSGWIAVNGGNYDPERPSGVYTLAHPTTSGVIDIASLLTAGDAVAWIRDLLRRRSDGAAWSDADIAAELERTAPDGTAVPLFLPYLGGERSPFVDTAVRGAFLGLDRHTTPPALIQSVLEGVAFAIRHNMESLPDGTPEATEIGVMRLVGGGAASTVWPQIIADTCNRSIDVVDTPVGATAFGACRLAAAALGIADPFRSRAPITARFAPSPKRREAANRRYEAFLKATSCARAIAPLLR